MILPESDDDSEGAEHKLRSRRAQQKYSKTSSSNFSEIFSLLKHRCRCVKGDCLTQFNGMENAIQACRDEFRKLNNGEKEKPSKTKLHDESLSRAIPF